jgi:hypothetical protein
LMAFLRPANCCGFDLIHWLISSCSEGIALVFPFSYPI